jgi:hypothetical protein
MCQSLLLVPASLSFLQLLGQSLGIIHLEIFPAVLTAVIQNGEATQACLGYHISASSPKVCEGTFI